ncbi:MAG: 3-phosphoshikimate 1-carboxyvinyltransferase [Gammaproteobacteria bacterium]|nr:3-phosphoshikimate 1-carboxyvinyltransferase [Gammaproteobacteria bacterium]
MTTDYLIEPGGRLCGCIRVPGDKSISHRAVMLGALADGVTHIEGLLQGEDVLATLAAFRAMGVDIVEPQPGRLTIRGVGLDGLRPPGHPLDMGNSGTAMRLMSGILAAQSFDSELVGDSSLHKRPMRRVVEPLNAMGACITMANGGCPPLSIKGGQRLQGTDYVMPVASAQVKSALLLAGLYADGVTSVTEPAPTRDHTERMLKGFGYDLSTADHTVRLQGGGRLKGCDIQIPSDLSSAAFFLVGAAIAPASTLQLEGVGVNPTRSGVLTLLQRMGADIELRHRREIGGEAIADIHMSHSRLRGITIPEDEVSLAIDEFPILFVAAACADGDTGLGGGGELRVKESDRIAVMAKGLQQLGITVQERADGVTIRGGQMSGGVVDTHGDHRVAMAFAMAGLRADGPLTIRDCENVNTSFPGFVAVAAAAGLGIQAVNAA